MLDLWYDSLSEPSPECTLADAARVHEISQALETLDSAASPSFASFPLHLPSPPQEALYNLSITPWIERTDVVNRHNISALSESLWRDLLPWHTPAEVAHPLVHWLTRTLANVLDATHHTHAMVRTETCLAPSDSSEIDTPGPHWHLDQSLQDITHPGSHLTCPRHQSTFFFVLKGALTLYRPVPSEVYDAFCEATYPIYYSHGVAKDDPIHRQLDPYPIQTPPPGHGYLHRTGFGSGVIHAVPEASERLFIKVIPEYPEILTKERFSHSQPQTFEETL